MAIGQESLTWRDAKGQTARMNYYVTFTADADRDTQASTIATAVNALSNAHNSSRTGGAPKLNDYTYGTNAEYPNCEDKAVFTFAAADGSLHRYQVPAPKLTVFKTDGQTVDPAAGIVATFTAAMIAASTSATTTTRGGSHITTFIGGIRQRRKTQRKMSILTLSADLASPAE